MNTVENNKHEGCIRGFFHVGEAWYSKSAISDEYLDEVLFGFYAPEGGTTGEMRMVWKDLGREVAAQLQAFDDSWDALAQFSDLLSLMAKSETPSSKQFCEMLKQCGFVDLTERVKGEHPRLQQA